MSLSKSIRDRLKQAIKEKDEPKKSILRLVLGEMNTLENRKSQRGELSDGQVVKIIKNIINGNKETMQYLSRTDPSYLTLRNENAFLLVLLPQEMSELEIRATLEGLSEQIKSAKADGPAIGLAMGFLKKQGKTADGTLVSRMVKELRGEA